MSNTKLTSIILLSLNQVEFTRNCLESIREYTNTPYEIIVIDNNSNQETIHYLETQEDIVLIKNKENKGFAGGCNQGMEIAKGDYFLLLNNDTIVTNNYLLNMIQVLESSEDIGIVGPVTNNTIGRQKLDIEFTYDNKDEIQQFGYRQSISGKKPLLTPRLIGFCMLFRKSFIDQIGMFDLNFKIGNYEDDDLCIRTLLANKKMFICQNSFIYHYKRATFDRNKLPFEEISMRNKKVLEDKWNFINWNHYAENSHYILERINDLKPKKILHLGCGIGALAISAKQNLDCYFVGVECHEIRGRIAKMYADDVNVITNSQELSKLPNEKYDVIIIEDMIETFGLNIMQEVKKYMKEDTTILLRVFNKYHISTYVTLLTKHIWRNTICAAAPNFVFSYGEISKKLIEYYDFDIINSIGIKKTLSKEDRDIYDLLSTYKEFEEESLIYNRIYELRNRVK